MPTASGNAPSLPPVRRCGVQVELDGHALSGEAVAWEQNVRLRHMCTRKYLCLVREADSWRFTLTEDHQDRNCIFRLHRVVRDDTYEIFFDSYARIEHAASGMWLHGLDQPYRLKQYESAAASSDPMDKIEWDGAKLRQISASREARYDDAFALVQVPPEYLLDFNFVAGLVRPIEIYVRRAEANASKNEQLSSYHHSVRPRPALHPAGRRPSQRRMGCFLIARRTAGRNLHCGFDG